MIVHQKYEDIVHYLQDALQANAEDEQNFKNIARVLQENVDKITLAKVDRAEIHPMQESIAQIEAIVYKLKSASGDSKSGLKDTYSKADVDKLLEQKLDKLTFEDQVSALMKGKKTKRFTADQVRSLTDSVNETSKSLDHSHLANMRQIPSLQSQTSKGNNHNLTKGGHGHHEHTPHGEFSHGGGTEVFDDNFDRNRNGTDGEESGFYDDPRSISDMQHVQDAIRDSNRALQKKASLVNTDKFDGAKWNGLTKGPGRSATGGFPVNAPGSFRINSESSQSGGLPSLAGAQGLEIQSQQRLMHSASESGIGNDPYVRDTSFLGAMNMGGGFNTHSKQMLRAPDAPMPNTRDTPDLEGDNL
jgi:hypothetical protein